MKNWIKLNSFLVLIAGYLLFFLDSEAIKMQLSRLKKVLFRFFEHKAAFIRLIFKK